MIVDDRPDHAPKLGIFSYMLAITSAISGLMYGYDTGIVSSAMLFVPHNRGIGHLSSVWKEVIVSVTPGVAAIGCLFAGPLSNYIGRRKIILVASLVFVIGALVCAGAVERYMLLFGRVLLGVAIGFATMITSIYIGETSPLPIRGRLLTIFDLMITFGFVLADVVSGLFAYIDPNNIGWRLMFGFAAIPTGIQFIAFLFLPESPRWLLANGRHDDAYRVLDRVYRSDSVWIKYEMAAIADEIERERKAKEEYGTHVRKALMVGIFLMVFPLLSGITTIMYYTGTIIRSAGIKDNHTAIWISCAIAGVHFVFTFIPIYLIDKIGRRRLLLFSVAGVCFSLILIAIGFLLINRDSAVIEPNNYSGISIGNHGDARIIECLKYTNCDSCVTDEYCGYCESKIGGNNGKEIRQCLPVDDENSDFSSFGNCIANKSSMISDDHIEIEFNDQSCYTKYMFLPIALLIVFQIFFSSGYGALPWVLNAEIYPLWARSTCVSLTTSIHAAFNLLVTLTFLSLTESITKYGAFFVYAFLTAVAFVLFFIYVPETKNTRLDDVEFLFMKKLDRVEMRRRTEKNSENASVDRSSRQTAENDSNVKEEEQQQSQRKEPFSVSAV